MSRTNQGSKGPGYEYWSRRNPDFFMNPGRESKKRTHRHERRKANEELAEHMASLEDPYYCVCCGEACDNILCEECERE